MYNQIYINRIIPVLVGLIITPIKTLRAMAFWKVIGRVVVGGDQAVGVCTDAEFKDGKVYLQIHFLDPDFPKKIARLQGEDKVWMRIRMEADEGGGLITADLGTTFRNFAGLGVPRPETVLGDGWFPASWWRYAADRRGMGLSSHDMRAVLGLHDLLHRRVRQRPKVVLPRAPWGEMAVAHFMSPHPFRSERMSHKDIQRGRPQE